MCQVHHRTNHYSLDVHCFFLGPYLALAILAQPHTCILTVTADNSHNQFASIYQCLRCTSDEHSEPKYYSEKKEKAHKMRFDEVKKQKDCPMKYEPFKKSNHPLKIMVSGSLHYYGVVPIALIVLTPHVYRSSMVDWRC